MLSRWNLDPILIGFLLLALLIYGLGGGAGRPGSAPIGGWRRLSFHAGWALGTLAVISPLCPLSVSLFSARVGQHMLLTTVVAPLIALGQPGAAFAAVLGRRPARRSRQIEAARPISASGAFMAALWLWHSPVPYAATFHGDLIYWTMHLTTFGAALWLWSSLFAAGAERLGGLVVAVAVTTLQMGLLGAIITLAGRPLYTPHLLTTWAWGLSPLQDQQLGGALMWVPAGVIFTIGFVFAFMALLRKAEARALDASPAGHAA